MPLSSVSFASWSPAGPSMTFQASCKVGNRNGRPKAEYSGTTVDIEPCELAAKSTVPLRSDVRIGTSSPSCAAGATWTINRPPLFSFTSSANFTAASCFGLPTAALWPSVSLVCANALVVATSSAASARFLTIFFMLMSPWIFLVIR